MKNITISYTNNTIDITKKFAEAAGKIGSKEYRELQEVRRDNPGFTINVVADKKKAPKNNYAGLDFNYMKSYIEKHDDEEKSIMAEYLELRGESEDAKAIGAKSASIFEIREWFLRQYPAIKDFYEKREKLLKPDSKKTEAKETEKTEDTAAA
jgi:hypothetical protein